MKLKMEMEVELDDDTVGVMGGEQNIRYIFTDALHDFLMARTVLAGGTTSDYVAKRYVNMSEAFKARKRVEVAARCMLKGELHNAAITMKITKLPEI